MPQDYYREYRIKTLYNKLNAIEKELRPKCDAAELEIAETFLKIIKNADEGLLKREDACSWFAGFMQYDFLSPEMHEIACLAGNLELPDKHVSGNIKEKWAELKERLEKLRNKLTQRK